MMKKTLVFAIVGIMVLLVTAGCGGNESNPWGYEDQESEYSPMPSRSSSPETAASDTPSESETDASVPDETPSESTAETESSGNAGNAAVGEKAQAVAELAKSLIGTEFMMGGSGPDKFDNSGFVYYCFKQNGISVPRLTKDIAAAGTELTRDQVQPGDIVVFSHEPGGSAGFVGIYAGDGKFISCNNEKSPTKEQNFDSGYWSQRFVCGRRVA